MNFDDLRVYRGKSCQVVIRSKYLKVFYQYDPLWRALDPETSRKVRLGNYERLFDEARHRVRAWESTHIPAIP